MSNVGYATLQIVPSFKGAQEQLSKGIQVPADQVAAKAGSSSGKNYAKAFLLGSAALATGAAALGVKAAKVFSTVGGEVSKLTRLTGGSADEMSRLRFAAGQTGIDATKLGAGLGILSKHLGANDKAAKSMGVSYRDASGNAKPLNTVLLDLSERFKTMPNGIDKNRLALQLFGRSGLDMLPFLNKGKDGLQDLETAAKRFGLVLTDNNLAAVKANVVAHREFAAAMQGLQLQVGQYVLPALTAMAQLATRTLLPAIVTISNFTRDHVAPAFVAAFEGALRVILPFKYALVRLIAGFTGEFDHIDEAYGEFLIGARIRADFDKVRAFVQDKLVPVFTDRLFPALRRIADFAKGNLGPALAGIGVGGLVAFAPQLVNLAGSLGGVIQAIAVLPLSIGAGVAAFAALAAGFVYAYRTSAPFRAEVDKLARVLKADLKVVLTDIGVAVRGLAAGFLNADVTSSGLFGTMERLGKATRELVGVLRDNLVPILAGLGTYLAVTKIAAFAATVSEFLAVTGAAFAAAATEGGVLSAVIAALGGPVTLAAVGIAALVGGVIYAYQHFAVFREAVQTTARYLVDQFNNAVAWFRTIWPQISEAVGHVMNVIRDIITVVLNVVSALWRAWGDDLLNIVGVIFNYIKETVANALQVVRGVVQFVLAIINGDWGKAWDALKLIVGAVFKEIGTILKAEFGIVRGLFDGFVSTIQQVWAGLWNGMKGVVDNIWVGIQNAVRRGVNLIIDAINLLIKAYNLLPFHKDLDLIKHLGTVDHNTQAQKDSGNYLGGIGGFALGGTVPGPIGSPQLILAHGGEEVIPVGQRYAASSSTAAAASPPSGNASAWAGPTYLVLPDGRVLGEVVSKEMYDRRDERT